MNYFEKHLGDYIKDTVSLTMLEDGAYNRLLDQIYQTERALPMDKKEVYRVARANSAAERKAVDYVLAKFFHVTDDGYMQKRAQVLIEEYWDRQPAEESKRENAKVRQQRSRARRQFLFDQLREYGITPEFNAPSKQLEAELSRVTSRDGNNSVTRDDTATQAPITNPQSPDLKPKANTATPHLTEVGAKKAEGAGCTPGEISMAMRAIGVNGDPGDMRLKALSAQGVTLDTVQAACKEAKKSKNGQAISPGYIIAIIERWAKEAADIQAQGAKPPIDFTRNESARDRQRRETNEALTGRQQHAHDRKIIDLN